MIDVPADQARVDGVGRLLAAGPRLAVLNERAGGRIGAPIAIPSLAMLVHLAQTLLIPVSRLVIAADGDDDIELLANARLEAGGVTLEIGGWTRRPDDRHGSLKPHLLPRLPIPRLTTGHGLRTVRCA